MIKISGTRLAPPTLKAVIYWTVFGPNFGPLKNNLTSGECALAEFSRMTDLYSIIKRNLDDASKSGDKKALVNALVSSVGLLAEVVEQKDLALRDAREQIRTLEFMVKGLRTALEDTDIALQEVAKFSSIKYADKLVDIEIFRKNFSMSTKDFQQVW